MANFGSYIKISGAYRQVSGLNYKVAGSYRTVTAAYIKIAGQYKQIYTGSDPVTYTFHLAQAKAGRVDEWRTGPLRSGAYTDSGVVSRNFSIFTLTNDTTGVSLTTRLAERPVVKAAYLTLYRQNSAHGYNPGSGAFYVGRYNSFYTDAVPNFGAFDFSTAAYQNLGIYQGEWVSVNLALSGGTGVAQTLLNAARTTPLLFGNKNTAGEYQTYDYYQDTDYFLFENTDAGTLRPYISVTLDYM